MTAGESGGQKTTQPNVLESQPVLSAHAIAAAAQAAIVAIVTMLASLGWISVNPEQMGAIERMLAAVGALLVLVVPQTLALLWARQQVTPTANPRTESGEPALIVPADLVTTAQTAVMAEREGRQ